MWYHLSLDPLLPDPLPSLRKPEVAFTDVTDACFCVSPTVWQCVIAISQPGRRYIYKVTVCNPIPAIMDNNNVADFHQTGEHRITQQIFDAHTNGIPVQRTGYLDITKDLLHSLKSGLLHPPIQCNSELELSLLWHRNGLEWSFNSDGMQSLKQLKQTGALRTNRH
jgi:hypothetical protein